MKESKKGNNSLDIIARAPRPTTRIPRHDLQDLQVLLRRLHVVLVRALVAIRTLAAQEMHIAHLEFFHALDLGLVVLEGRVDALTLAVARDGVLGERTVLLDWDYLLCWWGRWRQCCDGGCASGPVERGAGLGVARLVACGGDGLGGRVVHGAEERGCGSGLDAVHWYYALRRRRLNGREHDLLGAENGAEF